MLLEMCCICGFVHKDDRISYRAYKPHYHWVTEEKTTGSLTLHATVCATCISPNNTGRRHLDSSHWKTFFDAKALTPEHFKVQYSLNAPLPAAYFRWADYHYKQFIACYAE